MKQCMEVIEMTCGEIRKKKKYNKKWVMDEYGGRELSLQERMRRLRK